MSLAVAPDIAHSASLRSPIAVLTPATPERWAVHAGDVFVPADSLLDSRKDDKLLKLALVSGFSVAERLSAQALEALRAGGWDAAAWNMPRVAVGGPMRRESYPEDAGGRLMLDIKVQLVGLVAGWGRLSSYRPTIYVSYRVLDARGRPLHLPRAIYYCHAGFHCAQGAVPQRMAVVDDDSQCSFATFAAVEKAGAQLWRCFDSALMRIAEKLVADLDESGV